MNLKLLMIVGLLVSSLVICAAATERQSGMAVAQLTPEKKPNPPAAQPPVNKPVAKPVVPPPVNRPVVQQPPAGLLKPAPQPAKPTQQIAPLQQQKPAQIETRKPPVLTQQPAPQQKQPDIKKLPATTQQPAQIQKPAGGPNQGLLAPLAARPPSQVAPADRRLDKVRSERHETHEGNRTVIQEQNRTIVKENGRTIIQHDDLDRLRLGARDVHVERRGNNTETIVVRPDGGQIINIVDGNGRLLRRIRRDASGHEFVLIDNRYDGPPGAFFLNMPPPIVRIPRDRYIVDADQADETLLYDTLIAPPVMPIDRRYTLDEIRYTDALRERMPRIDLDTVTFDTGSWYVTPDQARLLQPIAEAMRRAIRRNPNEIYLIEGHTDAVGNDIDNLSLSDRRAEAVADILTQDFGIPPENLTPQGYGEQYLKIPTQGPERRNRRVTVRRITPLLTGQN
jgi:outer membrane protein OmpA-like peptidoglycan-associated protein